MEGFLRFMDVLVTLQSNAELTLLEIGRFSDLMYLTEKLDEAWDELRFTLRPDPDEKGVFYFEKDQEGEPELLAGRVLKIKEKAYAEPMVHDLIMSEYDHFVQEFGPME